MPWAFFIPLGIVVITLAAGISGIVSEIAYERGYNDGVGDARYLAAVIDPDVIEAELADDSYRWN
jgi:hypothetical protein